ncbi:formin homology5 [Actinidia rufa]|uniref:Formin homology5 n=1 Tax=Actinidia rufa TaxID=165716 RepID=A0A7J0G720_9ERIC|nr:formin homology5 [Actinidia rufa]
MLHLCSTPQASCTELRKSRLFLKLLEAVLKTGNRMNDGTFRGGALAFKLDTLLKLADVKGTDGKTTLLHFVVQEIIRSEGVRAARVARESQSMSSIRSDDLLEEMIHYRSLGLQMVSGLSNELENVKKAAILDADNLTGAAAKLGHQLNAEVDIMSILDEEKRIMALVKSTADYFHGNAGKDEGLRLFIIVRDFLIILDKACKDVKDAPRKPNKTPSKDVPTAKPPSEPRQSPDPRQRLFPAIQERRMDDSTSTEQEKQDLHSSHAPLKMLPGNPRSPPPPSSKEPAENVPNKAAVEAEQDPEVFKQQFPYSTSDIDTSSGKETEVITVITLGDIPTYPLQRKKLVEMGLIFRRFLPTRRK